MSRVPGPAPDCAYCPRLVDYRRANRLAHDDWHNAPVPSFGSPAARMLVVGLAPGLKGANRTGRPFTGDVAGELLYPTLLKFGFAKGTYAARPDDGLELVDCRVTNAVRCVPPGNKPTGSEMANCRQFLEAELEAMKRLRIVLALGRIAHHSVVAAAGLKLSAIPFAHGAVHELPGSRLPAVVRLADSYHCSRYNTSTGRLTAGMFEAVFAAIRDRLDRAPAA